MIEKLKNKKFIIELCILIVFGLYLFVPVIISFIKEPRFNIILIVYLLFCLNYLYLFLYKEKNNHIFLLLIIFSLGFISYLSIKGLIEAVIYNNDTISIRIAFVTLVVRIVFTILVLLSFIIIEVLCIEKDDSNVNKSLFIQNSVYAVVLFICVVFTLISLFKRTYTRKDSDVWIVFIFSLLLLIIYLIMMFRNKNYLWLNLICAFLFGTLAFSGTMSMIEFIVAEGNSFAQYDIFIPILIAFVLPIVYLVISIINNKSKSLTM